MMNYKFIFLFLCTIGLSANAMQLSKKKEINNQLLNAIKSGNLKEVESLIASGVDVTSLDYRGCTTLMGAANCGFESIVQLLSKYVPVNIQDDFGWTALLFAARNGHEAAVKTLIEAGADVNLLDNRGRSAFECAAESHDLSLMKCLLQAGADVHKGGSVLQFAIIYSNQEARDLVVKAMLNLTPSQKDQMCSIAFCMNEADKNSAWRDCKLPVLERLCHEYFAENEKKTMEEINKIVNKKIAQQLLEQYFPEKFSDQQKN